MTELFNKNEGDQTFDFSIDPEKNYLEELVGDGKKFKTPEELARGKAEADATVEFFKQQMDRLREDYKKEHELNTTRANLEEILNEIKHLKSASTDKDETLDENGTDTTKSALDPKELETLVEQKLTEAERKRHRDNNLQVVADKLRERFGSNYQAALRDKTRKLGLTEDVVTRLAETSPDAFFRTLGLAEETKDEDDFISPPRSNKETTTFQASSSKIKPGTWRWYEEMRKAEPKKYWDKSTQQQLLKDLSKHGDAFYS